MRTELKKLIRKELRISTNVISDNDVENLAAALDGDRTGWVPGGCGLGFLENESWEKKLKVFKAWNFLEQRLELKIYSFRSQ